MELLLLFHQRDALRDRMLGVRRVALLLVLVSFCRSVSGQTGPQISTAGVVGAGLSSPPLQIVSPGAIVSIFGTNFAPPGFALGVASGDLVDGSLPVNLGGVCVSVNSTAAFMLAVRPTQLNVQIPAIATGGPATVQVTTNCGKANSQASNALMVDTNAATPEFFYFSHPASGPAPVAAINAKTSAPVGDGTIAGSLPAKPGDVVTIYATGLGAVSPSVPPGTLPASAAKTVGQVSVTLGGVALDPSTVLYAGVTPTYAGLYQINLQIPPTAPDGFQPLEILVGNAVSAAGAAMQISNPAVQIPCDLPAVSHFSANPFLLASAGSIDLSWSADGATSVSLSPGIGKVAVAGDQTVNVSATTVFQLTATNACGSVQAQLPVPIGTPTISEVSAATQAPATLTGSQRLARSQKPRDATGLSPGAAGVLAVNVDPTQVEGVVFTSPSGTQLMADVAGVDGNGLIYFRVPYLAETAASTSAVTYWVGVLVGGQVVPGIPVQVLPLAYAGNALADFQAQADAYFAGLLSALQGLSSDPDVGAAVPILTDGVNHYKAAVDAMIASLKSNGSAVVPYDLPSTSNATPATATVNLSDIAGYMAYSNNYASGSGVVDTSGSTNSVLFKGGLQPRDSAHVGCIALTRPLLGACLPVDQAANGLPGQALSSFSSYSTAASAVAPTVAAPFAAASSLMSDAGQLTAGMCKLFSIWLRGFTIYPKYPPNGLRLSPVPDDPQMVAVFANLTTGDYGTSVLQYAESKGVSGVLSKIPAANAGVQGRALNGIKMENGYLKDKLTAAQDASKPKPGDDTVQVGACDLTDFYALHKSKIVEKATGTVQGEPNYYFRGRKKNRVERMYIVPIASHFLIGANVLKSLGPASLRRFRGPLAVGKGKGLVPNATASLQGEASDQLQISQDLPSNGLALDPGGEVDDSVQASGAQSNILVADTGNGDETGDFHYQIQLNNQGNLTSLTGPGSLDFLLSQSTLGLEILNPSLVLDGTPYIDLQIVTNPSCSLTGTFSTATTKAQISQSQTFHVQADAANLILGQNALTAVGAQCSTTVTIALSDQ